MAWQVPLHEVTVLRLVTVTSSSLCPGYLHQYCGIRVICFLWHEPGRAKARPRRQLTVRSDLYIMDW